MNRKILSLITILCIFTVSLLGQVAYASKVDSANAVDQATINAMPTYYISWGEIPGATNYRISCRDITYSENGPQLFSDRNVGNHLEYTITSNLLIDGHYYRVYVSGHDRSGKKVGSDYLFFTY